MKKISLLILLILLFSVLNSAVLQKYYYKDYGYITRIVFVFDKKPVKFIKKTSNKLILIIQNGTSSQKVKEKIFYKNKVLKSIKLQKNDNQLKILIGAIRGYYFKYFTMYDTGVYKIVFDIFASEKATTPQMHKSYAYFYKSIGKNKMAKLHREMANKFNSVTKPKIDSINITKIETIKKDTIKAVVTKLETLHTKAENKKKELPKKEVKTPKVKIKIPYIFWVFGIGLVFALVIIILPKKNKAKSVDRKGGIWDESFDENLVIILLEKGWKIPEIAREVNLDEKTVKKIKKKNKNILKK